MNTPWTNGSDFAQLQFSFVPPPPLKKAGSRFFKHLETASLQALHFPISFSPSKRWNLGFCGGVFIWYVLAPDMSYSSLSACTPSHQEDCILNLICIRCSTCASHERPLALVASIVKPSFFSSLLLGQGRYPCCTPS